MHVGGGLTAFVFALLFLSGQAQVQVVPQGIESVNGSNNVTMGCTSPLVDSGGVMVCNGSLSYLIDGCSPDIDTSTSDWASQLVTVRRGTTPDIPFPHVLLTFGFDTAVSLTGIEMDLFNCPDWNIGAPSITVYLNPDYNLAATTNILYSDPIVFASNNSHQSSCDSLSNVTFSGGSFLSGPHRTVYILVDLSHTSSIQWVHVGEVRFIGIDRPTCLQPTLSSPPIMTEPTYSSSSPVATSMSTQSSSPSLNATTTSAPYEEATTPPPNHLPTNTSSEVLTVLTSIHTSSTVIERISASGSAVSTEITMPISSSPSPTTALTHGTEIITQSPTMTDNDTG
ncbi:hypothetical protein GBAR_LOCUS589 [Geodia barretti]|uniref:Uncharacterized protein n=1 Tax=Geodia barretti TaxID=519541 RepID=A0AA35QT12_GEOBA|nr:hypothetical protein GBAR_LOCUS589 [Geodia barretti]